MLVDVQSRDFEVLMSSRSTRATLVVIAITCLADRGSAQGVTTRADSSAACRGAHYVTATRVDSVAQPRTAARRPDIRLIAVLQADEVRFSAQPHIAVRVCGDLDSARIIARRNLPDRVVVGETYRDVYIAVELLGRVKTIDSTSARRTPR
jgi:hypothetical protein